MGKETIQNDGIVTDNATGGSKSGSSSTEAASNGRNDATGGGGQTTTEKEIVPKLVEIEPLTDDERERDKKAKNAARQKKYRENKNSPKKTKSQKANDTQAVEMLLTTAFGILASRNGFQHWALSDVEVKSIATPLSKVIERYSVVVSDENADAIALGIACTTIFAPRVVTSIMTRPPKNNTVKRSRQSERKINTGSDSNVDRANERQAADAESNGTTAYGAMPII